jgi:hypothetical protein
LQQLHLVDTTLALEGLRIKPKGDYQDILDISSLRVEGGEIFPLLQKGKIDTITLQSLDAKAVRYKNGVLDWQEYLKMPSQEKSSPKATKSKPWDLQVGKINLQHIALQLEDKTVSPNVTTTINPLHIYLSDVTSLGKTPLHYGVKMEINSNTQCSMDGDLVHNKLDLTTHLACRHFDVTHYKPYIDDIAKKSLEVYNVNLLSLTHNLALDAHIYEDNKGGLITHLKDANISFEKLKIAKRTNKEQLLRLGKFAIQDAIYKSDTKSLDIDTIIMDRLFVYLQRYKNKKLNIENVIVAKKPTKKVTKKAINKSQEEPLHTHIKNFKIQHANISFRDRTLHPSVTQRVHNCTITLNDIDTKKGSWLRYKASLRVNKKGSVYLRGKVRPQPLAQKGSFYLKNIALKDISAYIEQQSYVRLDDGAISLRGYETYKPSKYAPDVRVQGKFKLNSLFVNNTQDESLLLSLNEMDMEAFTLELFPNRLYIDEVKVDAFYLNAMIDANKTLNFAKLQKGVVQHATKQENNTTMQETKKTDPFPVTIAKIDVTSGSAHFQDDSIPIKFQTQIHDLDGMIYAISTLPGETTYIDIKGEVDKYGSTLLKGSIDSADPKKYTDIDFTFQNLALSSLSGYSAEFAGYKIDSGKLYLDLGYEIFNSKLHATNNIMIKKIKLGEEIQDENVTHLPLGFVIALLEDSDGIIDIDMPIEGDVDSPDFKYGTLVWKTLGNLIAKAVTSPFKFLGSMLGIDGEDLEYVEFASAKTLITPPQREKLDKLAKMMRKRPKIELEIVGAYDKAQDSLGLQKQKLIALVLQKSDDKNIKDKESVLTLNVLEEIFEKAKGKKALEALQEKLHQAYEDDVDYKRVYKKELISGCLALQRVTQQELEALAQQRAEAISTYMVQEKHLAMQRITIAQTYTQSEAQKMVEVKLEIKVDVK